MVQRANYSTVYEEDVYVDPLEQAIRDYIATGPSPAELAAAMAQYGVSAEQIAQATNYTVEQVNTYVATPTPDPTPTPAPEPIPVAQPVVPEAVVSAPVAPPVQPPPPTPVVESAPVVPQPQPQYSAPPATQATTAATTTTTTPPTVAQVTAAIDKWQTDNPGATSQQLAIAIKNGMGLTPEVQQALATKYNMSTADITASYNDLIAKPVTPATSVLPPTVAQVTAAIDKWTTDNPGATPQQLAIAIKNGMGLTPEVTQALAAKYNMSTADITTNFNTLVAQPVVPTTTTTTTPTTTAPTVAQVRTAIDKWTTDNPGATPEQLAAAIKGGMGMNDTVAQALAEKYNSTPAAIVESYNRALDPYAGVQVTDSEGKSYDAKTLMSLASQVAKNLDTTKSSGGAFSTKGENIGFDYNALSSAYGNKAFTSGDQVAFDIARQLLGQGITNYDQVKNIQKTTVTDTYQGEGGDYTQTRDVYVDPTTGREINTSIGATYTGAGNTQYHIDPTTGKFYTTAESSSDVSPEMMTALSIGASFLIPGISAVLATELGISSAAATALANAGLGLAMGGDPKSVLLTAGLNLSGVGNSIDKALMGKLSDFAGDSFAGLSGTTLDDALITASDAIKRAGTNFLLTGDTTSALTAAAGSVINSVVTGATDSKALGAGAAAYVQTGSLSTAATVGLSTAAYQAGLNYQTDAVDLFNGVKNSLLQTTVANQLTTAGITTADINSLVEDDLQSTIGDNGIVVTGTAGGGGNITNLGTQVITAGGGNTKINTTIGSVPDLGTQVITATGNTKVGNAISSVTDLGTQVITANGNVKVGNTISSVTDLGNVLITANGNVKIGNAISDVTDLGTVTVVGNRYVGPNVTLPDFTPNVIVSGNILGNIGNVTSNVGNVGSNLVTVGNTVTVIDTPNNQSNVSTPITTTIGGSNITPLKFASGGLNPGYIAPTPFYQTTNDAQSKFYWGSHPYQTGGITGQVFDPVLYNTVPEAPRIPFGSQTVNQPLTSAQIAAIVANPGSNNSQQRTQQASTVAAPVAPSPAPIAIQQPVAQPAPVAPVYEPPVQQPPAPVYQAPPAPVQPPAPVAPLPLPESPDGGNAIPVQQQPGGSVISYQDWLAQNTGKYRINDYYQEGQPERGADYWNLPGEWQAQDDYSKLIRQANQPVYDQYDQYLNQAYNDYYAQNPEGSAGYDRYNPMMPQIRPAVIMPNYQDQLGAWQSPWSRYDNPGQSFSEWYDSTYNKPGYQQLNNVQRVQPNFKSGFGDFGGFYGSSTPMSMDVVFNKTDLTPDQFYQQQIDQMYQPAPQFATSSVTQQTPVQPVAPTPTPGLPSWMPPDTTTTTMPNGATGYNINGMIYDQTGSIISSGVGPVAP